MKLQYVKLKNFKSYPDAETKFDLSFDGIKLVVGANGDGKSTFFDAIIWCIYGKNQDDADGIVNRKTKKNCKVEVGFKIGGKNYSIIRYRKHETNGNKLLFFKGTKNISQRTAGATQELIDNVIEIQYNTMISSVILSSELYKSFLRSSRADRLKIFESILSLKEITIFYNKLKKLKVPIDEKVLLEEREKEKIEVSIASLSDNIDEYKEGVKKTLLKLKTDKEKLQDEVFKLTGKIADYDKIDVDKELLNNETYDLIIKQNIEIQNEIDKSKEKILNINNLINNYEANKLKIKKWEEVDVNAEIVLLDKYEEDIAHNEKIQNGISKLSSGLKDNKFLSNSIDEKENEKRNLLSEIDKIKSNMNICPVCKQKVDEELTKSLLDKNNKEVISIQNEIDKRAKELASNEKNNEEINLAINKLKGMLVDDLHKPVYTREYLINLEKKIREAKTENLLFKKDIEAADKSNKEIKNLIREKELKIKENKENINEPEHHTIFLKDLKEKLVLLKEEAEEKRLEIEKIDVKAKSSYDKGYIDNTLETIKKLKSKLKIVKKKLKDAKIERNHYDILLTVFSNKDSGFKKFFINKMVSIFNDRVNFYMPFFFDEIIKVTFDKDLNETIKVDNEVVNFASFSSGQKTRFDIAISFSLFMMVKTFFSTVINLLVFDEILDGNLDEKGFNSVYEIVENLGEHNTVFVVSHQEFYKEKFNHHIQIKRNSKGFSYIKKEV